MASWRSVYQKSFVVLLREQAVNYCAQMPIQVFYHNVDVGEYFADLVVESTVLIELKAVSALESAHEKQVLNYLKATHLEVGLLFNFGSRPQVRRLILDNERKRPPPKLKPLVPDLLTIRVNPWSFREIRVDF